MKLVIVSLPLEYFIKCNYFLSFFCHIETEQKEKLRNKRLLGKFYYKMRNCSEKRDREREKKCWKLENRIRLKLRNSINTYSVV